MKYLLCLGCVALALTGITHASAAERQVITLWPEGVPNLKTNASAERVVDGRISNIHQPALLVFGPEPTNANGTAVIFCSGGGYVRSDTPPVFIAATMADKTVPVENSLAFYQALRDAGVPAELHAYAQGSHGNSLDPQYGPTAEWLTRCEEWMRFNGWLAGPDSTK